MITPDHDPCCSAHGIPMSCERYRRTHFVEVRPCCATDAAKLREEQAEQRSHPHCWTGTSYEHACHKPSGRTCIVPECSAAAGTLWGPYFCPEHDAARLDRISANLASIVYGG